MKSFLDILKTPAVYAALSGLMSAIGWEVQDSHIIDHLLGAAGALFGIIGIAMGTRKDEPKP